MFKEKLETSLFQSFCYLSRHIFRLKRGECGWHRRQRLFGENPPFSVRVIASATSWRPFHSKIYSKIAFALNKKKPKKKTASSWKRKVSPKSLNCKTVSLNPHNWPYQLRIFSHSGWFPFESLSFYTDDSRTQNSRNRILWRTFSFWEAREPNRFSLTANRGLRPATGNLIQAQLFICFPGKRPSVPGKWRVRNRSSCFEKIWY